MGFAAVFLGDGLHVTPGSKKNAVCTVRLFFFFFFLNSVNFTTLKNATSLLGVACLKVWHISYSGIMKKYLKLLEKSRH